jgi:hypothetical protein
MLGFRLVRVTEEDTEREYSGYSEREEDRPVTDAEVGALYREAKELTGVYVKNLEPYLKVAEAAEAVGHVAVESTVANVVDSTKADK